MPVPVLQTPASWHGSLAVQTTGFDPVQPPAWHVSVWVQAFASFPAVPFALLGFEQTPVPVLQTPASWHWSLAVQTTGFDPAQTPAWHVSVWVQAFASLHAVPFALLGFEQTPVPVLQTPASWHWSLAVQTTGFDPAQTPAWHVSVWVQAFASLHAVPFALLGFEQTPVPVLQTPASWHWSLAVQTTGFDPAQTPAWHVSVWVQAFASLHAVPFALFGFEQRPVPVLQTPASWHWSLAVQTTGFDPVQTPAWHVSVCVQAFPSLQGVPFGEVEQSTAQPGRPVLRVGSHVRVCLRFEMTTV